MKFLKALYNDFEAEFAMVTVVAILYIFQYEETTRPINK